MRTEIVVVIDDIDGVSDAYPHTFEIDGTRYEIDLNDDNYGRLLDALKPYLAAGRKTGGRSTRHPQAARTAHRDVPTQRRPATYTRTVVPPSAATVRAWWAANASADLPPHSSHGRIPERVTEAYNAKDQAARGVTPLFRSPRTKVKETA